MMRNEMGNKVYIPLTQGQMTIIDEEDFQLAKQYKWHAHKQHNIYYAVTTIGQKPNRKAVRLHRLLSNCPERMVVDHIDGNGLNNCRDNLRICTNSENVKNRKIQINNTSGYKGVTWHKREQKWRAQIQMNNKQIQLGSFDNPEDAYAAYCEAAEKYHGEFKNFGKNEE